MRRQLMLCVVVAGTFVASAVWGYASEREGSSPVGFGAVWLDQPRVGKAARIRFSMAGQYGGEGTARLQLSPGLKLVAGDTLHRGRGIGPSKRWIVTLSPDRPGDLEIRGYLTVVEGDIVHELDLVLPFHVEAESAAVEPSRLTRLETVRGGQRYRYGERFLVPIEQPEEVTQAEIQRSGQRAAGPTVLEVVCGTCQGASQTVPMVAFVGANGKVVDAGLRTSVKGVSGEAVAAATHAIGEAQYRPAQFKGKAFADWVLVEVRVKSGK